MCNIGKAFQRLITPPGTGALEAAGIQAQANQAARDKAAAEAAAAATAATQRQNEILQQQAETAQQALTFQREAVQASKEAAVPILDSVSARVAAEERQRRLIGGPGSFAAVSSRQFLGSAPIGFRMLMGM